METTRSSCDGCIELQLEHSALKLKNKELVEAISNQMNENARLQKTIDYLQQENFEIRSKFNNSKNIVSQIEFAAKSFIGELRNATEAFMPIMQLCAISTSTNRSSSGTQTQAVKPSVVNGHVLHSPTISLTRITDNVELMSTSSSNVENVTERRTTVTDEESGDDEAEDNNEEVEDVEINRRLDTIPEDEGVFDITPPLSPPNNLGNEQLVKNIRVILSPLSKSVLERKLVRLNKTSDDSEMSSFSESISRLSVLQIKVERINTSNSSDTLLDKSSLHIKENNTSLANKSNSRTLEFTPPLTRRKSSVYANRSNINYSYTDYKDSNLIKYTSTPKPPLMENTLNGTSFNQSKFVTKRGQRQEKKNTVLSSDEESDDDEAEDNNEEVEDVEINRRLDTIPEDEGVFDITPPLSPPNNLGNEQLVKNIRVILSPLSKSVLERLNKTSDESEMSSFSESKELSFSENISQLSVLQNKVERITTSNSSDTLLDKSSLHIKENNTSLANKSNSRTFEFTPPLTRRKSSIYANRSNINYSYTDYKDSNLIKYTSTPKPPLMENTLNGTSFNQSKFVTKRGQRQAKKNTVLSSPPISPLKTITGRPKRAAKPLTLKEPSLGKKLRRS